MNIDIKNAVNNLLITCDSIKEHSFGDASIKSIDELVVVDILTFIDYISQDEWTELWKKSAKLDYRPIVDVRSIKPKNEKTSDIRSAILETAKYPVKPMELNYDSAIFSILLVCDSY